MGLPCLRFQPLLSENSLCKQQAHRLPEASSPKSFVGRGGKAVDCSGNRSTLGKEETELVREK